jgi:hypothetical protein
MSYNKVMKGKKRIERIIQKERADLRHMIAKAQYLRNLTRENPPVLCERQLKWNSRRSSVVCTFKNALTGEVLETYGTGSLNAMNTKIESYKAIHPSVQVVKV